MRELTMNGFIGLAAMLAIAFYFSCRVAVLQVRKNSSPDFSNFAVDNDRGQVEDSRG